MLRCCFYSVVKQPSEKTDAGLKRGDVLVVLVVVPSWWLHARVALLRGELQLTGWA